MLLHKYKTEEAIENIYNSSNILASKYNVHNNKLAIIGDKGINNVVSENFWDDIKDQMISHFKKGDFSVGLSNGIIKAGEQLKSHFPYTSDDTNELTNEISFGDE